MPSAAGVPWNLAATYGVQMTNPPSGSCKGCGKTVYAEPMVASGAQHRSGWSAIPERCEACSQYDPIAAFNYQFGKEMEALETPLLVFLAVFIAASCGAVYWLTPLGFVRSIASCFFAVVAFWTIAEPSIVNTARFTYSQLLLGYTKNSMGTRHAPLSRSDISWVRRQWAHVRAFVFADKVHSISLVLAFGSLHLALGTSWPPNKSQMATTLFAASTYLLIIGFSTAQYKAELKLDAWYARTGGDRNGLRWVRSFIVGSKVYCLGLVLASGCWYIALESAWPSILRRSAIPFLVADIAFLLNYPPDSRNHLIRKVAFLALSLLAVAALWIALGPSGLKAIANGFSAVLEFIGGKVESALRNR
jgi:hypothetical protein